MKAILFQDIGQVSLEQVSDPAIEHPGDVIVQVLSTAICGSDLHPYFGRETGLDAGTVMGHEMAGDVNEDAPMDVQPPKPEMDDMFRPQEDISYLDIPTFLRKQAD